jgi:predicted metal-dependent peptidase
MDPRISKQRTALVLDQPFFGALALRLKVTEDPSCQTFWTDGVSLGYNPAYLASINDLEVRGVLGHEVLHAANGHCWRAGDRDPDLWNDACDYAINPIVLDAGMLLPGKPLVDPRFKGMSAEEIYAVLAQERREAQKSGQGAAGQRGGDSSAAGSPPDPSQGQGEPQSANGAKTPQGGQSQSGSQPCGEVRQYRGEDQPLQEAEWKVAVHQAAKAAQMRGDLPGDLQAMVQQSVEPIVDWRAVLHRFAQQASPTDYSFAMPNRRYLHMGLYLPALHEPAVGDAVFVRDSSGSVFDETQAQFAAEILAVNESLRPRRLIVLDCDTRVTQMQVFERGEPVDLLPVRGGGGTAFADPFRRLGTEDINPAFLVYLTDTFGSYPDEEPPYPVLWASTVPLRRANLAPFGEMVEVIC